MFYTSGNQRELVSFGEYVYETRELKTIYDSHVSFNRKALVVQHKFGEKEMYLISYNTIVCAYSPVTGFARYWGGYSATTMRHINEFRRQLGLSSMNKKAWMETEVEEMR